MGVYQFGEKVHPKTLCWSDLPLIWHAPVSDLHIDLEIVYG
jgi:hypothetical protein